MVLPSLLTRQEAADRARVSLLTFNRLLRDGCGPALTIIGGKSFVSDTEFARWISAQTQQRQIEGAAA